MLSFCASALLDFRSFCLSFKTDRADTGPADLAGMCQQTKDHQFWTKEGILYYGDHFKADQLTDGMNACIHFERIDKAFN